MDESKYLIQQPVSGWTEAEVRTLILEHGILLRTLARLQEQLGRLLREAATHGRSDVATAPGAPDFP